MKLPFLRTLLFALLLAPIAAFAQANYPISLSSPDQALGQQSITQQLTFTRSSPFVAGASAYLELVADGNAGHVPVFGPAFINMAGVTWNNASGAINVVKFWYDGLNAFYRLDQPGIPYSTFAGLAIPNASNGATETVKPQVTTALNAIAENWYFDFSFNSTFASTGSLYNDPVLIEGYNAGYLLGQYTPDPFGTYLGIEGEYEYAGQTTGQSGTATGGTILTLIDTGKTWFVNQWANWVAYNTVTGCRGLIVSNTATTLTITSPVLVDGLTACASANANGQAYNIMTRQQEDYFEITQNFSGGGQRNFRPFIFTADKATMWAQGQLGTNGVVTLTAATAANPASFTTSGNHGLITGEYVKFQSLAGGTWNTLNTVQYPVTATGATTFTIPVNATGFGTYTASSGTETAEPSFNGTTMLLGNSNIGTGLFLNQPSWNPSNTDTLFEFLPNSQLQVIGRASTGGSAGLILNTDATSNSVFVETFDGITTGKMYTGGLANMEIGVCNVAGANCLQAVEVYQPDSATAMTILGATPNLARGTVNVTSTGQTATDSSIAIRAGASQTGNTIEAYDSTNTTLKFAVDSAWNVKAPSYISIGTTFTLGTGTGACATTSTLTGGATTGSFLCTGTAGASTQVINLPTAPNGWECSASDVTSGVVWGQVVPVATNSAKITGTIGTTSDRVIFNCSGF